MQNHYTPANRVETIYQKITKMADLNSLRAEILKAAYHAGEGHIPSAFSIIEIIYAIYSEHNICPLGESPKSSASGNFILSKGHGSLALYAVLCHFKILAWDDFRSFCSIDSLCGGHPDRLKHPAFSVSSGSLGHGLPIATGIALAGTLQGKERSPQIYCLMGDGEANEGTTWESLLFARSRKLGNLTVIIDQNLSGERAVPMRDLATFFSGLGLNISEVNGHCLKELDIALRRTEVDVPSIIVAKTVKGKGVKAMENNPEWHHKTPNPEQLASFLEELK